MGFSLRSNQSGTLGQGSVNNVIDCLRNALATQWDTMTLSHAIGIYAPDENGA